jgi:hypothetical protein
MHKDNHDLPVAFASNALYVLERNDARSPDVYDSVLIPIITNKIDYLHIEGVGQAVWSLAQAGKFDNHDLWNKLADRVTQKEFGDKLTYVKNM